MSWRKDFEVVYIGILLTNKRDQKWLITVAAIIAYIMPGQQTIAHSTWHSMECIDACTLAAKHYF